MACNNTLGTSIDFFLEASYLLYYNLNEIDLLPKLFYIDNIKYNVTLKITNIFIVTSGRSIFSMCIFCSWVNRILNDKHDKDLNFKI